MAHINRKTGKATRNSGGRVRRPAPAIIVQAERVATAMREAFLNMKVRVFDTGTANGLSGHQRQSKVVDAVLNSVKQNAGNNRVGRGWTANLSARTVRQLTEQGVFA